MIATDWTHLYKKYKGQWVALAKDEVTVLGAGQTLRQAMDRAKKVSDQKPSFTRVPENLNITINII